MSLSASTVWDVWPGLGDDNNGGSFVLGGSGNDFSQQAIAQITIDGTTNTATVHSTTTQINITGATVASTWVDNTFNFNNYNGGTGTARHYRVTAVDVPNNRITVDQAAGTAGQTLTGRMGGAKASLGGAGAGHVAFNLIWCKTTAENTVTSASNNVAGGCLSLAGTSTVRGYTTTRGDGGKFVVKADGSITTFTLIDCSPGGGSVIRDIELNGNSRTSSKGFTAGGNQVSVYDCIIRNCTNNAMQGNTNMHAVNCYVTGCSTQTACNGGHYLGCVVVGNTVTAITPTTGCSVCHCVVANNTGASTDGIELGSSVVVTDNRVFGNGRHGINSANTRGVIINNTTYGNTGTGIITGGPAIVLSNASGGNGTNYNLSTAFRAVAVPDPNITLTGDPFVNSGASITSYAAAVEAFSFKGGHGAGHPCFWGSVPIPRFEDRFSAPSYRP